MELKKENVRSLSWGLYSPTGILYGMFRYEEDARAFMRDGMIIKPLSFEHIMMAAEKENGYPMKVYLNILATPKE